MKNANQFFAMMSRMKFINRWGLMRNTVQENIAQHSLDTAMIAHALAVIHNIFYCEKKEDELPQDRIAVLAMYHDATEIITGDMPTPVKYFAPEIRESYRQVEHAAAEGLLDMVPDELRDTYESILHEDDSEKILWKYVKAADKLSAYIKCVEEMRMGNVDFKQAEQTTHQALVDMQMPEVEYFLEKFLPAYLLTLDEQA